jgi:hypothetical protein
LAVYLLYAIILAVLIDSAAGSLRAFKNRISAQLVKNFNGGLVP